MIEFIENEYSPIGLSIYIIWFLLDLILVLLFMFHESNIKENAVTKLKFVISYCMTILALTILFEDGHFMLSCFVIDLIMAVCFVYNVIFDKLIKNTLIVITGIFRLLGDLFAWLSYRHEAGINEIGIIVLLLNIIYVIMLACKKTEKSIFSGLIETPSIE